MADTQYDGIFGNGISIAFTPTSGTPFGTAQAQVETYKSPQLTVDQPTFTPISGSNAGAEQFVLGQIKKQDCPLKVTYSKTARSAAITCAQAKIKGTLVVTHGDGAVETCVGAALTGVTPGEENATGLVTDDLTFSMPMGSTQYTFVTGASITVVNATETMTAGGKAMDMGAAPYSADGKAPIRMYLLNPAGNSAITIDVPVANPYEGFGASMSITLQAGESVGLNGTTDIVADASDMLDISGTGTDSLIVQVHLQ